MFKKIAVLVMVTLVLAAGLSRPAKALGIVHHYTCSWVMSNGVQVSTNWTGPLLTPAQEGNIADNSCIEKETEIRNDNTGCGGIDDPPAGDVCHNNARGDAVSYCNSVAMICFET